MSVFSTLFKKHSGCCHNVFTSCCVTNVVGRFYKVPYTEYKNAILKYFPNSTEEEIQKSYDEIVLPTRATTGSAGYDIHTPTSFVVNPWEEITIPTGIGCSIDSGWFLMIVPRSGLGFKMYTRLANTCGIIDSDYSGSSNHGHIMVKLRSENLNEKQLTVNSGDAIAQSIFIPYGITEDDNATGERDGGFGSTDGGKNATSN